MSENTELQKTEELRLQVADELDTIFRDVLPWTLAQNSPAEMLENHSELDSKAVRNFLESSYLFKITEVSVAEEGVEDAIARSLGKRHQTLITAAYQSELCVSTIVIGEGGGALSIYLAVSGQDDAKDIFRHQLQGIYPGKGIDLKADEGKDSVLVKALEKKHFGGIVTGIPPVKLDGERQHFDLTSVIRSMHGQPFVLMTVARPVPKQRAAQQIIEFMRIKDQCHSLVKCTLMQSQIDETHQEAGRSLAENKGVGTNSSIMKGGSGGGNASVFGSGAGTAGVNLSGAVSVMTGGGAGVPGVGWAMGSYTYTGTVGGTLSGTLTAGGSLGGNFGRSKSITEGVSTFDSTTVGESESIGWSKSTGKSLQIEQQNSLAMELEQISDKLIRRLRIGLNSGVWEVFLTYATVSETAARILSGAVCGELLKADPDALPSRNLVAALPVGLPIYLPKGTHSGDLLNANPLCSHVSSEEAAILLSPPKASVPGFDVRLKPPLSLTDAGASTEGFPIGSICELGRKIEGALFHFSQQDIRKHIFVAGLTGSGKTTTVKQLLARSGTPFLVLESAKREYRRLLIDSEFRDDLQIFTVGDSNVAPLRHNPFVVLPHVSALVHIDHLKSIFNASFSLYGPMPYLLEQCLHNIYKKKGWNLTVGRHHVVKINGIQDCQKHWHIFPTIRDLLTEIKLVVDTAGYRGELRDNIQSALIARLESLAVGGKGFIFNNHECLDLEALLQSKVVFELESLADDDDKAFFVGLMLALISEHRQVAARQSKLRHEDKLLHVLVIEEAHRLLKNISTERTSEFLGNPRGKAVETFCNIIAEMRSLGQGVIVAEQIPTKIAPDVLKNTNTKIAHRLVAADDQKAMGASLGLPDSDAHYLNQLVTGSALVHKEGMARPVEVSVEATLTNEPVGDDLVRERARTAFWSGSDKGIGNGTDLEALLLLHESCLLDSPILPAIARRLANSVLLSGKELDEALPVAVYEVRKGHRQDYLRDETIVLAIEKCFLTFLLSPSLDLGDAKEPSDEVMDALYRFWHQRREMAAERLRHVLDRWRDSSAAERIKCFAASSVILDMPRKPDEQRIPELISHELLINDQAAESQIRETLRSIA